MQRENYSRDKAILPELKKLKKKLSAKEVSAVFMEVKDWTCGALIGGNIALNQD